jgi:hypothetical protein
MMNATFRRGPEFGAVLVAALAFYTPGESSSHKSTSNLATSHASCDAATTTNPPRPRLEKLSSASPYVTQTPVTAPSFVRRSLLAPLGVSLPLPRIITPKDPALKLSNRYIQRRLRDETRLRDLLEQATSTRGNPQAIRELQDQLYEITYGKGITPQAREDFLVRYGCTGWNDKVLETLVDLCASRGIVEIGAGHGQWARAIDDAYEQRHPSTTLHQRKKRFDFCLAYDDMSNLPLNTHVYNPFTQPHHDYFGQVHTLEEGAMERVLKSWACRGRVLLMVYPPPGDMAMEVVRHYVEAAAENDTVVFVGEGRGGANGNDELFDYFESGNWILLEIVDVQTPPGDKGYEKMFILRRQRRDL